MRPFQTLKFSAGLNAESPAYMLAVDGQVAGINNWDYLKLKYSNTKEQVYSRTRWENTLESIRAGQDTGGCTILQSSAAGGEVGAAYICFALLMRGGAIKAAVRLVVN